MSNDYYDVSIKEVRLAQLNGRDNFSFTKLDLADRLAAKLREFGIDPDKT